MRERCPICDDNGYVDRYDCPRLEEPGHPSFNDEAFERGRRAARRHMRKVKVILDAETVVRESDGRTLLLITSRCGERVLGFQVLDTEEDV